MALRNVVVGDDSFSRFHSSCHKERSNATKECHHSAEVHVGGAAGSSGRGRAAERI